jgi:hypothetical protein
MNPHPIFRQEALRRHLAPRPIEGELLELHRRWMAATYWLLCAACGISLAYLALTDVQNHARGPALVRGDILVVLLPAEFRTAVRPGLPMWLEIDGSSTESRKLTIDSVEDEILPPAEARRMLGSSMADQVMPRGALVVVRARAHDGRSLGGWAGTASRAGMVGWAEVQLEGRRSLLQHLSGVRPPWGPRE